MRMYRLLFDGPTSGGAVFFGQGWPYYRLSYVQRIGTMVAKAKNTDVQMPVGAWMRRNGHGRPRATLTANIALKND